MEEGIFFSDQTTDHWLTKAKIKIKTCAMLDFFKESDRAIRSKKREGTRKVN
jgi:hypothetical protein